MCDTHREQVCILEGIAGKGKSTVAQTVALRSGRTLGASFFFARDVDRLNTAKDFFTTIAYQLALTRIDFANAIGKALESAPDASTKTPHEQFRRLVLEPLHHLCPQGILPTVIVIDALDECEKEESKTVLRLILQEIHRLPSFKSVVTRRFQDFVGAIIVLQDPLALQPLANLLNVKSRDLKNTLRSLHSVINSTPETDPLRVYHASFPDFIVNSVRCIRQELVIDTSDQHRRLAFRCFNVMKTLKMNLCDLKDSEKYNEKATIPDLQERVKEKIPPELDYSCRYWAVHLANSNTVDEPLLLQLRYFVYTHLLHWLEALSLIGKLDVAYRSLEHIRQMKEERFQEICNDGQRFIMRFQGSFATSPLHIYYSALPFTPKDTELFRTYNGRRLASGSADKTVRLWNGTTGDHVSTMEGHLGSIHSVAFSPDGRRLASGSEDKTVRLWNGMTGEHFSTLEGHSSWISSLIFSSDGCRLATGSGDNTVQAVGWNDWRACLNAGGSFWEYIFRVIFS
ncbi:hypothetical protein F5887DRAFT_886532 [Amanita rubescens]|nr:hypothetical protein F5887DRAFT_886532 [Amanita rubescens]